MLFKIETEEGADLGTYEASSEAEALEQYARDMDYGSWSEACASAGSS